MKLKLHHLEICTSNLERIVNLLTNQFGFKIVAIRDTFLCSQTVVQSGKTVFVVTSRKVNNNDNSSSPENHNSKLEECEPWTIFCCDKQNSHHTDSVFNISIQVEDLSECLKRLKNLECRVIHSPRRLSNGDSWVKYAIVTSCCGNVVHTLIEKPNTAEDDFDDWFLPGYTRINPTGQKEDTFLTTHLDHVALACKIGETTKIIQWFEEAFGMKRFLTNREDTEEDGLVIDGDVGMRLKVMEFWKCAEAGLSSVPFHVKNKKTDTFKIVVVESLPNIQNTQIENFIRDHRGPGLQHIGLHTTNIVETVRRMSQNGIQFRYPPPTYYTKIGQMDAILSVGEDLDKLRKYGILLDTEADVFEDEIEYEKSLENRYLMQIFTFPIFELDTFFLEVIHRKGARGFGVGNVTALARSVNAYQEEQRKAKEFISANTSTSSS